MLSYQTKFKTQRGVVLVLALVILLILTIIGVATMSGTIMQERMAGNFKTQTEVFGEASSGVSQALDYYYEEIAAISTAPRVNADGQVCGYIHGGDADDWLWPHGGGFDVVITQDGRQIERQLYCCQDWEWVAAESICLENPSRLFMLNRGVLRDGQAVNGVEGTLAVRDIEIRLAEAAPVELFPAINIPGCVGAVDAPTSGVFRVDGSCSAAIVTEFADGAGKIISAIGDKNIGNYNGGVVAGDTGRPWNDPITMAEFVFWAKLGIDPANYYNVSIYTDNGSTQYGTLAAPQITYFDGDVNMGGSISGAGIMIVRGALNWNGTPDFQGLLITLGGGFSVGGGGKGGNPAGQFVATNLEATDATADLLGREVLQYPVFSDFDSSMNSIVLLNDVDTTGLGFRNQPIIRATTVSSGLPQGLLFDGDSGDFYKVDDLVYPLIVTAGDPLLAESLTLEDKDGVESYSLPAGGASPRDRFGRLIPDFVRNNWPPDSYGYNPNDWAWNPVGMPFTFSTACTDLEFKGGGKALFQADARLLQQQRHRLLCVDKNIVTADPDLPSGFNYTDPDDSAVCEHSVPNFAYNANYLAGVPGSSLEPNHFSWHAWQPVQRCLGIGADSDIIIAGWRENIGWRDEEFAGCAALLKAERCP